MVKRESPTAEKFPQEDVREKPPFFPKEKAENSVPPREKRFKNRNPGGPKNGKPEGESQKKAVFKGIKNRRSAPKGKLRENFKGIAPKKKINAKENEN